MTNQITLKEALELVEFQKNCLGKWYVDTVKGDCGLVEGNCDYVEGNCGTVKGAVYGTINGRDWQYAETPKEKLKRLVEEGALKSQLLEAIYQLEDN